MILQPIVDIAEICARKKVLNVILSPGSRCAPLTLSFSRHPAIDVKTVSDERSAAFIALGIAQMSEKPTVLVCTSGSAALNYGPAVAEAFYQQVPLLLLTADRPPEWIDQLDGQTIRQPDIYGNHVKKSYHLPVEYNHADAHWHINRVINEAINLSQSFPPGPVHINVPVREPFYPETNEKLTYNQEIRVIDQHYPAVGLPDEMKNILQQKLKTFKKTLIVAGQGRADASLLSFLESFTISHHIPVIADVISNCQSLENAIIHQDAFLGIKEQTLLSQLAPELLITFGQSVISKQLKLYLRKYRPAKHWHIQPGGEVADTFQSLTDVYRTTPAEFFKAWYASSGPAMVEQESYLKQWKNADQMIAQSWGRHFPGHTLSEFAAVRSVLEVIPETSILHLANSMPVRYANYLGVRGKGVEVFANRGTSGIDGSVSVAVGCALGTDKIVTLVTGDMAFFYDRNAFWNNYLPSNLRVIILNNHAGGIFGLIKGPDRQPELEEFFETRQPLKARYLCDEFHIEYRYCDDFSSLQKHLKGFFEDGNQPKVLEIETDKKINKKFFTEFKSSIEKIYGN